MKFGIWTIVAICCSFCLYFNSSLAQVVQVAGFSFSNDYSHSDYFYPMTKQISQENNLDKIFAGYVKKIKNKDIKFAFEQSGNKNDNSIAMTFSVNKESKIVTKLSDKQWKIVVVLDSQILFFDFNQMKVINTIPLTVTYIGVENKEPTNEDLKKILEGLLVGNNPNVTTNVFKVASQRIADIKIKEKYGNRIKVGNVIISDNAKNIIESNKGNVSGYKMLVAQSFSKNLAEKQGVAVLPFTFGESIGNKMTLTFSDLRVYNLEVPEADYLVDITIDNFKTSDNKLSATALTRFFAVFSKIKFYQPDTNKVYMNSKIRHIQQKTMSTTEVTSDLFGYGATTEDLFVQFLKNINNVDSDWLDNAVAPDLKSKTKDEMKAVSALLQKCK
ncbi:MAG: hypothetical protein PUB15_07055 [Ruminobacter sp.]|nr:hypothetical protein [Ruminobacter sp.]